MATRIFLARRVARIVPLYWLTTTFYLALALAAPALVNGTPDPRFVLASYAFWPAMRPDGVVQPLYSLGWTLNYEMFFYLLFALALPWPRRWAVCVVAAALAGLVAWVQALGAPLPLAFWGDPIVLEFGLGMALGLARTDGVLLPLAGRFMLGAVGIALFAGVAAGLFAGAPRVLAFGVPAGFLVAACGLGREHALAEDAWIVRLGAILGDASYALYLIHPFAIRGLRQLVQATGLEAALGPWPFVLAALLAVLAASVATYRWLERPLTAALRRVLEPRRDRVSQAA